MSSTRSRFISDFQSFVSRRCVILLIAISGILLLYLLLISLKVRAAVTLVNFRANAQTGAVLIEWKTATELDNAGFFINRSLSQNSGYSRIGDFISANGDPLSGATYQYTDRNVTNGVTYWYKLETIDIQQNSDLYEPPVSVIPGGTLTSTATATATRTQGIGISTATRTPTATRTAQQSSPSRTPTRSGLNSNPVPSSTSGQTEFPANTPQFTETIITTIVSSDTITTTLAGTATLIPFPTIDLEFPYPAGVAVPTLPSTPNSLPGISWFTPMRLLIILFITFVWVFLGGWYYFSLRKLE